MATSVRGEEKEALKGAARECPIRLLLTVEEGAQLRGQARSWGMTDEKLAEILLAEALDLIADGALDIAGVRERRMQ